MEEEKGRRGVGCGSEGNKKGGREDGTSDNRKF